MSSAPVRIAVRQRTPEWREARRDLITATDIAAILGVSAFRCEADVAADKQGAEPDAENVRMRIGTALEPLIAEEYVRETGRRVRRLAGLYRHPTLSWAAASPDYVAVGEKRGVELKWSGSKARWSDGLPDDVAAQAQWQALVMGWRAVDVAALVTDELRVFTVDADPALQADLIAVATDFRARLAAGGPFAHDAASVRRAYPFDDGSEIPADPDVAAAVKALVDTRARRRALEEDEARLEAAIKARMGVASVLTGAGYPVTWKRSKDRTETDWKAVAADALAPIAETERAALVRAHTTVREGVRYFRVGEKERE